VPMLTQQCSTLKLAVLSEQQGVAATGCSFAGKATAEEVPSFGRGEKIPS